MDITAVDLGAVLDHLRSRFRDAPPEGAIVGRTAIRDEVAEHLGCSLLEAEQIVDTMVARHSIGIAQAADGPALWKFGGGERTA